jgi:hypothetical protein
MDGFNTVEVITWVWELLKWPERLLMQYHRPILSCYLYAGATATVHKALLRDGGGFVR